MEMEEIKYICQIHMCGYCPFWDKDCMLCTIETTPIEWDLEEIERRLKNYGKEKTDRN